MRKVVALIVLFFFVATSNYGWTETPSHNSTTVKDVSESESVSLFDIFDIAKEIQKQIASSQEMRLPSSYLKYVEKSGKKNVNVNIQKCKNININYETANFNDQLNSTRCAYLLDLDDLLLSPLSSNADITGKSAADLLAEMLVFPDEEIRDIAKSILLDFFLFENFEYVFRYHEESTEDIYANITVDKLENGEDFVMKYSKPREERDNIYNKLYPELSLLKRIVGTIKAEILLVNMDKHIVAIEPQINQIADTVRRFDLAAAKDSCLLVDVPETVPKLLYSGSKWVFKQVGLNDLADDMTSAEDAVYDGIEKANEHLRSKAYLDLKSYQESDEYQELLLYKQVLINIIDSLCFFREIGYDKEADQKVISMAGKDNGHLAALVYGRVTIDTINNYTPKWKGEETYKGIAWEAEQEFKKNPYWKEFEFDTKVRPVLVSQLVLSVTTLGLSISSSLFPRVVATLKPGFLKVTRIVYKPTKSVSKFLNARSGELAKVVVDGPVDDIAREIGTGNPFSSNPKVQYNNPAIGSSSVSRVRTVPISEINQTGRTIGYYDAIAGEVATANILNPLTVLSPVADDLLVEPNIQTAKEWKQPDTKIETFDDLLSAFSHGAEPDLSNTEQLRAWLFYLGAKFGSHTHNMIAKPEARIVEVKQQYPELKKEPLTNYELETQNRVYPVVEGLDEFCKSLIKSLASLRSSLFQIDSNIGFWQKLLNKKDMSKEEFIKYLDKIIPEKERAKIADNNIDVTERATMLFDVLDKYRTQMIARGEDVGLINRAIVDLIHSIGANDKAITKKLKSDNGLERIEGLLELTGERDEFAILLGFENHFPEVLKKYNVKSPSGIDSESQLVGKISEFEKKVIDGSRSITGENTKIIRHLSFSESPYRSRLGGSDCSSGTYFDKAFDPNYNYFTLTDLTSSSSGHVTIVLGEASLNGEKVKVAFVDKVQNVNNVNLPYMLEGIRQSVLEKGYLLAIPKNLGDHHNHNGISNDQLTTNFIKKEIKLDVGSVLVGFKPHKNEYSFKNVYSRAYDLLDLHPVQKLSPPDNVNIKPGYKVSSWSIKDFSFNRVISGVVDLKRGDLEEKLKYIDVMSGLEGVAFIVDEDFGDTLMRWIENPAEDFRLRKRVVTHYLDKEGGKSISRLLDNFSEADQIQLIQNLIDTPRYLDLLKQASLSNNLNMISIGERIKSNRRVLVKFLTALARTDVENGFFFDVNKYFGVTAQELLKFNDNALQNIALLSTTTGNEKSIKDLYIKFYKQVEQGRVEVNETYYGKSALMWAASAGNTEEVVKLKDLGADVNYKKFNSIEPDHGWSAIIYAASNGHTETVVKLKELGADVNDKDCGQNTVIMCAAENGHTETVVKLKELGADVNAKDCVNNTAIVYAAWYGHTETVVKLKELGANVNQEQYDDLLRTAQSNYKNKKNSIIKNKIYNN